jgi:hypothetical protein
MIDYAPWGGEVDRVKKLIEYGRDDHPEEQDGDKAQTAWAVAIMDDCADCGDVRVELTVEEVGRPGYGQVAHLSPGTARRLHAALAKALGELGEQV